MGLAIRVENLSKQYRLGQIGTGTISHDLNRWWASLRGKDDPYSTIGATNDRSQKAMSDYVWALKDINFEIEQGDAVGIIGRNGAGKSTLLKILSRTTLPTTGSVKMKGRIASLLEVGTGFHPELTGRENIYQNGAILGMNRHEIARKFDEIVDFSGCEAYIDTPVKRYSSGMYVRLAFAVAAHLESEILIVDEVLAVGDAEFQKKCLGKMGDISKGEGRTVLFVSHNMAAVKSLCNKGVLLESGFIKTQGTIDHCISRYFKANDNAANYINFKDSHKNEWFQLNEIFVQTVTDNQKIDLDEYDEIILNTNIDIFKESENIKFTYVIHGNYSEPLFAFSHDGLSLKNGNNIISCRFPKGFLNIGEYYLSFYLIYNSKVTLYSSNDIFSFKIIEGNRPVGSWMGKEPGFIKPIFEWTN